MGSLSNKKFPVLFEIQMKSLNTETQFSIQDNPKLSAFSEEKEVLLQDGSILMVDAILENQMERGVPLTIIKLIVK